MTEWIKRMLVGCCVFGFVFIYLTNVFLDSNRIFLESNGTGPFFHASLTSLLSSSSSTLFPPPPPPLGLNSFVTNKSTINTNETTASIAQQEKEQVETVVEK